MVGAFGFGEGGGAYLNDDERRADVADGLQEVLRGARCSLCAVTGLRLAFFGADAVGISAHGPAFGFNWRGGVYQLWENNIGKGDDVYLMDFSVRRWLGNDSELSLSVRYLNDVSNTQGGVSLLGQGPTSPLAAYNGAYRFPLRGAEHEVDVFWIGLDGNHNPEFTARGFGGSAFAVLNAGQISADAVEADPDTGEPLPARDVQLLGYALNARLGYRYGNSPTKRVVLDLLHTSGDDGIDDDTYSGVMTANTWTSPGAIFTSHGAYLLFPHVNVVNRFYGAVTDLSNQGYGVSAAFLNASTDLIRNKLIFKLGAAGATSTVTPEGGGNMIGVEGNARLTWRIGPLLALEGHAAYMAPGDFFDSPDVVEGVEEDGRPPDAWTTFATLRWLLF